MNHINVDKCVHCRLCTKSCLFLEKHGLDLESFSKRPDLAYSCFLCGKCKDVCPKDIDGAAIALEMRCKRVDDNDGKLDDSAYKALMWEKNPYKFANYKKAKKKSVLFPGCNFPSFFPKTMKHLERVMKHHEIGIVYECCGKPVSELGLQKNASDNLKRIEERLIKQGVEELIVLCPNCYHFMKNRVSIPMVTIYEKLKELGEGTPIEKETIPVYYPCPDRREKRLFKDLQFFLNGQVTEPFGKVQCCGLGGCAAGKEPEASRKMAEMAKANSESELYTYCASCISNYRRKGFLQAYHVLPLILGIDENVPLGMQPLLNRAKRMF